MKNILYAAVRRIPTGKNLPSISAMLLIVSCCCPLLLSGQTKYIAHKSHGGTTADFRTALLTENAILLGSDFGLGDFDIEERISRLDSVIYISEDEIYMVTTFRTYRPHPEPRDTSDWQTERTRLYGHSLFGQNHNLSFIKENLDQYYNFINEAASTVFIGYDDREITPETNPQQQNTPETPAATSPLQTKKRTQQQSPDLSLESSESEDELEMVAINTIVVSQIPAPQSRRPFLWLGLLGILAIGGGWVLQRS